jgi:hypothetical protein
MPGELAVDFALCREDGIDPPHGFDSERCPAQFRELEELSARLFRLRPYGAPWLLCRR